MKEIYSACTRDLDWLGEASRITEKGIVCLARMKSLDIQRVAGRDENVFNKTSLGIVDGDDRAIQEIVDEPPLWERVWVMQEVDMRSRHVHAPSSSPQKVF